MSKLEEIDNFSEIFKANLSLLDVRAPVEFSVGSFPQAKNFPLMNDSERHEIGICYKEKGQNSAIQLGHELINGSIRQERVEKWLDFINKNPKGALYCFRGGLRSKITQEWIYEQSGVTYPRIKGGYKALRSYLLDEMHRIAKNKEFIVIGGQTGCGKTILLNQIDNSIDLEGLANHRGSAFGNNVSPQPKQIDFENALSIELIKKESYGHLLIEDEGNNIGMIHIPDAIKLKSRDSNIVLLTASLEERLHISLKSYVVDMERQFATVNPQKGFENYSNYWLSSLYKIQKRLGGQRYQLLLTQLKLALQKHKDNGDVSDYLPLIESLLVDYYDPMYNYQINNKKHRVIFEGNVQEVKKFLAKN